MKKMDKMIRITEIVGNMKEVTIDEFGWLLYVHGISMAYEREGYVFIFKVLSDILAENDKRKDLPPKILQSFMDIIYIKYDKKLFPILKARYIEYNTKTNKARITKSISEAISERDECFYASMMPIGTYYSDIVFEAISNEEMGKATK